jgi:hypothetical protein
MASDLLRVHLSRISLGANLNVLYWHGLSYTMNVNMKHHGCLPPCAALMCLGRCLSDVIDELQVPQIGVEADCRTWSSGSTNIL